MPKSKESKLAILGIEADVRARFLAGESFMEIARHYADQGVTKGMVAGYLFKRGIKRSGEVKPTVKEVPVTSVASVAVPVVSVEPIRESVKPVQVTQAWKPKVPVLPPRESRRFDVITWETGLAVATGLSAEDVVRKFIPHMDVDRLQMAVETYSEMVTTNFLILVVQDDKR